MKAYNRNYNFGHSEAMESRVLAPNTSYRDLQFECTVGAGPHAHCKHTCAILYGLTRFYVDSDFITHQTTADVSSCKESQCVFLVTM